MKFKINLNRNKRQKMLPIDYQYYIGDWIYKIIAKADAGFASFLHTRGYSTGNKTFKLFATLHWTLAWQNCGKKSRFSS